MVNDLRCPDTEYNPTPATAVPSQWVSGDGRWLDLLGRQADSFHYCNVMAASVLIASDFRLVLWLGKHETGVAGGNGHAVVIGNHRVEPCAGGHGGGQVYRVKGAQAGRCERGGGIQ